MIVDVVKIFVFPIIRDTEVVQKDSREAATYLTGSEDGMLAFLFKVLRHSSRAGDKIGRAHV